MKIKKKTAPKATNATLIADMQSAINHQTEVINENFKALKNLLGGKVKTVSKVTAKQSTPNLELEVAGGNEVFLNALQTIGRPSTTREIAKKLRITNPAMKKLSRNKKKFMQLLYTAASHLSKEGTVKRTKVGHRMYEYYLKNWSKANTRKVAA